MFQPFSLASTPPSTYPHSFAPPVFLLAPRSSLTQHAGASPIPSSPGDARYNTERSFKVPPLNSPSSPPLRCVLFFVSTPPFDSLVFVTSSYAVSCYSPVFTHRHAHENTFFFSPVAPLKRSTLLFPPSHLPAAMSTRGPRGFASPLAGLGFSKKRHCLSDIFPFPYPPPDSSFALFPLLKRTRNRPHK